MAQCFQGHNTKQSSNCCALCPLLAAALYKHPARDSDIVVHERVGCFLHGME